jgi:thioredoxin reductase (NADPH)
MDSIGGNFYLLYASDKIQLANDYEVIMFNLSGLSNNNTQSRHVKVLILGAGPAGLSAALYAARAELQPLVLTGIQPGGQAALTHTIENYPGFPNGVGGSELGELFQKQAERFGALIEHDTAQSVDLSERPFKIVTDNSIITTNTLIICTGANPNLLDIPGEALLTGKGVSYCGTCDGWFFKGKKVVVVGGGDSALEEGLFLTRFATSVTIVHRRDTLRAGMLLQKRAQENPKINFIWNSVVTEAIGTDKLTGIRLKNLMDKDESIYPTDGLFIFIGHTPNTRMFDGQLELEAGYVKVNERMHTSIPGVYAAGESADAHFKQVITSAGMGAAASIEATHYLEHEAVSAS